MRGGPKRWKGFSTLFKRGFCFLERGGLLLQKEGVFSFRNSIVYPQKYGGMVSLISEEPEQKGPDR